MGGSARDIVTTIVAPIVEPVKRIAEGKSLFGEDVKDPTGAKRAADSASREAAASEAGRQAEVKKLEEEERRSASRAASRAQSRIRERSAGLGNRSTILTSPLGVVGSPTGTQKTLLGA